MENLTFLSNAEVSSFEEMYSQYLSDPTSVDNGWKRFFEGFELGIKEFEKGRETPVPENVKKEFNVINLINAYRTRGHLFTKTNPVRERRKYAPTLDIENFGLAKEDIQTVFQAGSLLGIGAATLKEIIAHLTQTYCESIGAEYMYIRNPEIISWLQEKMERRKNTPDLSIDQKKHILDKLNEAVVFENFLHTKFVGQKRFSLEGAETLIPALDTVIEKGAELGISEFIIGMAHRGRLNVLANILKKKYSDIFSEFDGKDYDDDFFDGDVKYHMGYSNDFETSWSKKKVHLSLTPNPSHLETVDPVAEGISRAKIDHQYKGDFNKLSPILIHGDGAIAGQGIVYEVIQMSQLEGYKTGGTIHLVVNNQIGFTTNYMDARSSTYCTDVAKVVLSPVFHVNGDDVEALVYTIELAVEFRQKFNRDVFIDLLCYRKHGHNEGDEPRYTQPILYKAIAAHPNPRAIYVEKLINEGSISGEYSRKIEADFRLMLQGHLDDAKAINKAIISSYLQGVWKGLRMSNPEDFEKSPETGVPKGKLIDIGKRIATPPAGKKLFSKIEKIFKDRMAMLEGDGALDWGMAEHLAYGTLLLENIPIRISGQDVERGTFSHRHAVIKIEDSEEEYVPLNNLGKDQAPFNIYNSLLSEYGVLGFDYGYAMASPRSLTIWEAQFGDFFNGAQIIIDQYMSSAEDKWKRMNGIVLFLPHGYEHQGAEHSSARLERFLTLCSEDNMQILNCTTPANLFHALRRQMYQPFRKPLVIFTPKSLLRHPACISKLADLEKGCFREVFDDNLDPSKVKKLVFCNGHIYYDLIEYREVIKSSDVAIVRLEQLYPFPKKQLSVILKKYSKAKTKLWVQEEPGNMGAWGYMLRVFPEAELKLISRPESASPATGSPKKSQKQLKEILARVFEE